MDSLISIIVLTLVIGFSVVLVALVFIKKRAAAETDRRLQAELISMKLAAAKPKKKAEAAPKKETPPVPATGAVLINIGKDGEDWGDLSITTVTAMLRDGRLDWTDYYLDPVTNSWVALAEHPTLRQRGST